MPSVQNLSAGRYSIHQSRTRGVAYQKYDVPELQSHLIAESTYHCISRRQVVVDTMSMERRITLLCRRKDQGPGFHEPGP